MKVYSWPPSCTLGCTAAVTTARQPCRSPVRAAGTRRWRRRAGPAQSTYPRRHGLYHRCCGSASVRPPCGPPTAARSVCRQYSRVRLCLLRYPVAPIDPDRTEMAEAFRPISVAAYRRSLQTTEEGKQTKLSGLSHNPNPNPTSRRARAVLRRRCRCVALWPFGACGLALLTAHGARPSDLRLWDGRMHSARLRV